MKYGIRRSATTIFVFALLLALLLPAGTARAQDDGGSKPAGGAPGVGKIPDTLPEIQALIATIEKQISDLDQEATSLVSVSDQARRVEIRQRIKSLKLQMKILERRAAELQQNASQAGIQEIRERYRERIRAYEAQNAAARRETITRFEQILAENPDSRLAPEILWRLANLYFEEAHSQYLASWDSYESEVDQLFTQGQSDVVPEEPRHNYARSIELLNRILRNFPQYEHRDQVLYLMAYCLQEQNEDDRALVIYEQLIKDTPQSDYVPEAYVRMGEIYFSRDQFDRAIERYRHLMDYPESKFYDKALYKLGWSFYKQSDYENAVKYFTAVLTFYRDRPVTQRRRGQGDDLRQEAVDYIAISFTDASGVQGANAAMGFMNQIGDRDIGRQVLLKVGEVYDERTDYPQAREAYRAYIQTFPMAPDVPEVYGKIAQTFEKESRFEDAMQVYAEIGENLGPDSKWAQANQAAQEDIERAAKLRQTSIMAAATYHHEKAQNTSGAESQAHYQKAIENYELYLANYPDAEGAYEIAFNLGESYMELGQYEKAAEEYAKVVELHKDEDLWKNALFNRAKAYEQLVDQQGGLPNKEALAERDQKIAAGQGDASSQPKGVAIQATAMSDPAEKWIGALDQYVTLLPDSDKSPAMLYKIGEIYYLHGDFQNARKYFEQVFDRYPQHEVVAYATYYYIESYKQRDDYAGIIAATRRLPTGGNIGISSEQVEVLTAGATFKIAEQMLRDATATTPADPEKVTAAIQEYEKGIAEHPQDEKAAVALFNIGVAYENHLQNLVAANDAFMRLGQSYPRNEYAAKALLRAAFNFQILVEFDQAITAYRAYVQNFPEDKEAGNALFNQAALLEESGDLSGAITSYDQYLAKYASAEDAGEVAFTIARLHEKLGDASGAVAAYESYLQRGSDDASRMIEAYYRWGKLLQDMGKTKDAEARYLQAVAVFLRAKEADPQIDARYAAEAMFRATDARYQAYRALQFTGNIKRDADVLKTKAEAFKELKIAYEQIVTFGNYEWATAALYMIGLINQEFSDALLNAPAPEDLPEDQQDEYMFKLEEIAYPIKNRALEAFKQNVEKGINERQVNEWIVKSYEQLKKLEPQTKEPKFEKITVAESPAFVTADVDTNLPAAPAPAAPPAAPPAGQGGAK